MLKTELQKPFVFSLMSDDDLEFLCRFDVSHGLIVNLGVYHGRSLLGLCQRYGSERVVGIDLFDRKFGTDDKPNMLELSFIFSRLDFYPKIIKGDSRCPPDLESEVGLLFIDTHHTSDHLREEMSVWETKLSDDCIVMLHDYKRYYHHSYPQEIDRIFRSWRKLGESDQMVGFTRI